ncbi:hypothetical protein [Hansschlegelia plantiphila]|uniref:Uncharacterized protein n=1 Tax=Hansschlegelia plantiphila TaxID=374655 RepID=A0A9W6IZH7_9HYPH|nr:hypothetical protein [Hansschlegelia plantiphila]GLK67011.1 hypothetical protein GCM10008179_06490 [Hansschlegelia plantiphila]
MVILRRGSGDAAPAVTFKARVTGYSPEEQNGDVQQGDSKVIFLAEDLGDFPLPIKSQSNDAIWVGGEKLTVQAVDNRTRAIAGVLIAYELRVRG